jgi:hypothetical protein
MTTGGWWDTHGQWYMVPPYYGVPYPVYVPMPAPVQPIYQLFPPVGCVCPAGANHSCERGDCPRKAAKSAESTEAPAK